MLINKASVERGHIYMSRIADSLSNSERDAVFLSLFSYERDIDQDDLKYYASLKKAIPI